jgi:signal transduction histidine kinase
LLADLAGRNANGGGNGNGNGHAAPDETAGNGNRFFSERVRGLARTLDNIVWTVNPKNDSLDELTTYLCEFSQELFRMTSIRFRLDVDSDIPRRPITPEERSNMFLTAREAINNVIKHSGAAQAWLRIRMDGDNFCIRIQDDGCGFDPAAPENGKRNGLANMKSRIRELEGTFSLETAPGQGTTIFISVRIAPRESPVGHS